MHDGVPCGVGERLRLAEPAESEEVGNIIVTLTAQELCVALPVQS